MLEPAVIAQELATALAAVPAIRKAYGYVPDSIDVVPSAYVIVPELSITYDETMRRGMDEILVPVCVLVGRVDQAKAAQQTLLGLLSGESHATPVALKEILEADRTLNGACSNLRVTSADGIEVKQFAENAYLSVNVNLRIVG